MAGNDVTIFFSSTIDDLRDVRASLYSHYSGTGWHALFSEWPAFPTSRHPDAVTNCLEVVKDCDVFVMLLDRNYGDECYRGMSPTEAEYKTAIEHNKPTFIFTRDKLSADSEFHARLGRKPTSDGKRFYADLRLIEFLARMRQTYPVRWASKLCHRERHHSASRARDR